MKITLMKSILEITRQVQTFIFQIKNYLFNMLL